MSYWTYKIIEPALAGLETEKTLSRLEGEHFPFVSDVLKALKVDDTKVDHVNCTITSDDTRLVSYNIPTATEKNFIVVLLFTRQQ